MSGLAMMHQLRIAAGEMRLAATRMNQVGLPYLHGRPDEKSNGVMRVDTFLYPDQSFIPATTLAELRYR
jgi:hypothetical protein